MPTYYRNKKTDKIEAKFVGCDTQSTKYRNQELYERFETDETLPIEVMPVTIPPELPVQEAVKIKKPWWKFWKR